MLRRVLRKVKNVVKSVVFSTPQQAPTPAARPKPEQPMPTWMQPDAQDDGHHHNHSHSHEHSHGHEHNEHTEAADPQLEELDARVRESNLEVMVSETPNPNALKFTLSKKVAEQSFSASAGDTSNHEIANAILAIPGVASVFGVNDFVTVTKSAEVEDWETLYPSIERALHSLLSD